MFSVSFLASTYVTLRLLFLVLFLFLLFNGGSGNITRRQWNQWVYGLMKGAVFGYPGATYVKPPETRSWGTVFDRGPRGLECLTLVVEVSRPRKRDKAPRETGCLADADSLRSSTPCFQNRACLCSHPRQESRTLTCRVDGLRRECIALPPTGSGKDGFRWNSVMPSHALVQNALLPLQTTRLKGRALIPRPFLSMWLFCGNEQSE